MARLRAVAPDEKAPGRKRRLSITEAADQGSVRQQLVALRERIAKTVQDPNCPPRDLASLSRRLMEISKEIEAIDVREHEDENAATPTPDDEWAAV